LACERSGDATLITVRPGDPYLFPAFFAAGAANLLALPTVALALLGLILVPIFSFEFTIGFWLLLKGVRIAEADHIEHQIP